MVRLVEAPHRALAIHAVGHVAHPPQWLDGWRGGDRLSRVVVIGQDIPRHFPTRLLAAIEAEVAGFLAMHAHHLYPLRPNLTCGG